MNTFCVRLRSFLGRYHIRIAALVVGCYWLAGCATRLHGPATIPHRAPAAPLPGGNDLGWLLLALIGVAIVGIGLSAAGLVWLPFKRACLAGAAGFSAILATALTVKTIQPYLGWIVLVGGLVLLAGAAWAVWKLIKGGHLAAAYSKDAAAAPDDAALALVQAKHAADWARQGMTSVLAHYGLTFT